MLEGVVGQGYRLGGGGGGVGTQSMLGSPLVLSIKLVRSHIGEHAHISRNY